MKKIYLNEEDFMVLKTISDYIKDTEYENYLDLKITGKSVKDHICTYGIRLEKILESIGYNKTIDKFYEVK